MTELPPAYSPREPRAGDTVRCRVAESSCGILEKDQTYLVDSVKTAQGDLHVAVATAPRFFWDASRFEVVS